ncbi:MAG: hypothetical protein ACLFWM_11360, partial [Actinomycetota bacterium]
MSTQNASTEALYRRGLSRWVDRDLAGAVHSLEEALAVGDDDDGWWFAASRARAQIALEQNDLETARRRLNRLPGHGVGDAQHNALRARLALQGGDGESAGLLVSTAVEALNSDADRDPGTLMNGAIALMWCGEVLAELGFGAEANRLVARARRRVAAAGVDDPVVEAGLAMVEAAAMRLVGDSSRAAEILESVDVSASPELGIQVGAERARLAWTDGDRTAARSLYREAAGECDTLGYPALAETLRRETRSGPAALRTHEVELEDWARRWTEEQLADQRPYAVVVRLPMDQSPDAYRDLGRKVGEFLESRPHLGLVDGTGSDGRIWELFLE